LAASSEARAFAADVRRAQVRHNRAVVKPKSIRVVAFPVLITHPSVEGVLECQLYAASNVDYAKFRPESKVRVGAQYVQGTETDPGFAIRRNIYLFPIDATQFPNIVPAKGPLVSGHSCDGAIWLVENGDFLGILPFAVTGSVTPPHMLNENDFLDRKLAYCRSVKIPLGANSELADVPVEDLSAVKGVAMQTVYKAL